MRRITPFILIFVLLWSSCQNKDKKLIKKKIDSDIFFHDYRADFLRSDLGKYSYTERRKLFTRHISNEEYPLRVLVFQDSSIRVPGVTRHFAKIFGITTDKLFIDMVISELKNGDYAISEPSQTLRTKYIVDKTLIKINPVRYFLGLKKQIEKYNILSIEKYSNLDIIKIVFSNCDYLIYKPDDIEIKDKEEFKYIFKNGKKLDKNWYQFTDFTSTE